MNVYRFTLDRKKVSYGGGEAIVAADTPQEAFAILRKELTFERDFIDPIPQKLPQLISILGGPSLLTKSFYIE